MNTFSQVNNTFYQATVYQGTDNERAAKMVEYSMEGTFGAGMYFVNSRSSAEVYGENIISARVFMKNPWVISVDYDTEITEAEDFDHPGIDAILTLPNGRTLIDAAKQTEFGMLDNELQSILIAHGYDGVVATYGDGSQHIVAFRPEQVVVN